MHHITLLFFVTICGTALAGLVPHYQKLSTEQAERLESWDKAEEKQNIWQLSGQYEGDMILSPGQRTGLINPWFRWNNNVIPYELDPIFSASQVNLIHESLAVFAQISCVTVRPRVASDVDYVYITGDNTGCWSYVGRLGGRQLLNLQANGCVWDYIIQHELLHAAGFYHTQSATDRDTHVTIQWENIISGMEHNFDKYNANLITSFGQPYDYYSVMHYDPWSFTTNGDFTIVTHDPSAMSVIGQTFRISQIDINKLNLMYNCWN